MNHIIPSPLPRPARLPGAGWLAIFAWSLAATLPAAVDHSITQAAWRMSYGVTAVQMGDAAWLNQDADMDGESNGEECAAGTHPFQGSSVIAISALAISGNVSQVTFPTMIGKQYFVQKNAGLSNAGGWTTIATALLIGNGNPRTVNVLKEANMFYRVLVQDYDTDGDTVSDYAESVFQYNPASAYTGGPGGPTDAAALLAVIHLPSVVTVTPDDPAAAEDGPTSGVIMVRRTGGIEPLTIPLAVAGSATPGADYAALPATVTLPLFANSATLSVTPIPDGVAEGGEVVTVTPGAAPSYSLNGPASSSVLIADSTAPTGGGLTGRYYDTSNAVHAHADNFNPAQLKVTRIDPTVDFVWNTGMPATSSLGTAGSENWAARFEGFLVPSASGDHTFEIQADDGARVFVNGILVIDAWVAGSSTTTPMASSAVSLTAGTAVPIRVEYYEMNGNASVALRWTPPGSGSPANIPAANVFLDAAATTGGWAGLYWNNTAYFGLPRFGDYPAAINLNWGTGQPVGTLPAPDNFSAKWEGFLRPATTGDYTFDIQADDSARVYINDVLVIDASVAGSSTVTPMPSAAVSLTGLTRYPIRVEFAETTGNALAKLRWKTPGAASFVAIPVANVFRVADTTVPTTGLWATYYSNNALSGRPLYSVQETGAMITYDYVAAMPASANLGTAANDNWSARIEGYLHPTVSGNHNFNLQADDGARVYVDNVLVLNGWAPGSAATAIVSAPIFLTAGAPVPIRVEYYELNSNAILNVNWKVPGTGSYLPIAAASLFQDAAATLPGLTANYWRNTSMSGAASFTDNPAGLNTTAPVTLNWSTGQPAVTLAGINYSAIWEGYLTPTIAGDHIFDIQASDGARVYLNGNLIIDAWAANSAAITPLASALQNLAVGTRYPIRVEFYDAVAESIVMLRWRAPGATAFVAIPAANVFRAATGIATGYFATYYANSTLTPPASHSAVEAAVTYNLGAGTPLDPGMHQDTFTARWTGQVQPQYSEEYTFVVNCDDSAKLWINGQPLALLRADTNAVIDWPTNSTTVDRYARIALNAGQRYDLQLDFYEGTGTAICRLFWYSLSQPRQIIPQARLYPASVTPAPAAVMSPTTALALAGGPFTYQVKGSNGGSVSVTGLPAWLSFAGDVLSGTPPVGAEGDYQIVISVTNAAGSSQSLLNLHVAGTDRAITREYWNGVAGNSIASIPVGAAPSGTAALSSLEGPADFGDNYGARVRGYLTAPVTGNYYFWIAGSNAAELWISNDDEPVNRIKRAAVANGTAAQTWNAEAGQKSAWLALQAGERYYVEILHKAGTGAGDNVAVGWLKPGQTGSTPSEVVPGYALSNYVAPSAASTPGTLYVATMLSQGGATTNGVGTSTLRLSADETYATMRYNYSGLTGPIQSQHIHTDPYLTHASTIVYDIDQPETAGDGVQPDGSHKWTISPRGTLSAADIREAIKQGKAYINLHTALYPNGEIRGNYTAAGGSRTFTVPPAPPSWSDDHTDNAAASRFLTQASYGGSIADITALKNIPVAPYATGYEAWIEDQFTKPASRQLPDVLARVLLNYQNPFDETLTFNAWWLNSIGGPDQLRQRVAFALSEIMVVSAQGLLQDNARALSYYYDLLADNAFGNYRDLLETVSYSPTMGRYLDALRNDKPDPSVGRIPNENYAREIKQLFSIGLFRMWPDGTLILNSRDQLVPTYSQNEIVGFAHVFTGLDYGYDGAYRATFGGAVDWTRQMREVPGRHFAGKKRILNNEVLPGLETAGGTPVDPYAAHVAAQTNDPAYQALPAQELGAVHDQLFHHPNTAPFICRQLIQRLTMSHPPRDYLYRVVQKFNDNGAGVRGDLKAVIKAILLDYDARSLVAAAKPDAGKQREPVMRVAAAARAFRTQPTAGTYDQNGTRTLTINTTTPHRLVANNSIFLDFTTALPAGAPTPTSAIYAIASITGSQNTSTQFTANLAEWIAGTYSQPAGSTTVTVTSSGHWLDYGLRGYIKCLTGPGVGVLDGVQTVTSYYSVSTSTFTFEAPGAAPATARTGNLMIPRFTGSYVVSNSGQPAPNDRRLTLNTFRKHNFAVGDRVTLNFITNTIFFPADAEFVVATVPDPDTFTVLGSSTAGNLTNQQENAIYMFPHLPQPLVRNGALAGRASTFSMGATELDISQTPLNAPTVFNFFVPDYKFPGTLASQGLTTPEFEDTSDTNVVRQANFMWNGVMNPSNTNGISSFRGGSNALVMDFWPWMGNATDLGLGAGPMPGVPWTNDQNIGVLIDRMNTLLMGGQLPASGKAIIQSFITANTGTNLYTNITYNNSTPTDTQKRDRVRAVIHFIISSADYNIQR